MNRPLLETANITPGALAAISTFHTDTVEEVAKAVKANRVVVVGMAQNPVVKQAKKALDEAGVSFTYLAYGSYVSGWKKRLAIKLWSGWPTYPQVFLDGKLVGGYQETAKLISAGQLTK